MSTRCRHLHSKVIDSRAYRQPLLLRATHAPASQRRRRRKCMKCGWLWSTHEVNASDYRAYVKMSKKLSQIAALLAERTAR